MSDALKLSAETRERAGKGASRAVRRTGRVPAVIYGDKQPPVSIHIEEKLLVRQLASGHFLNSVVELDIAGQVHRTLPRDVQFHPVNDRPIHVDFLRLGAGTRVTVEVPVRFINEALAPGLKRGGVINIVRHEIELSVPADTIPDEILIDMTGLDVGDSVHISAVKLPEGSTPVITDRDFTIATLVAPSSLKSDDAAAGDEPAAA